MKRSLWILSLLLSITAFGQVDPVLPDVLNQTNVEGVKVGTWVEFHPEGAIRNVTQYKNGELHGVRLEMNIHGQTILQEFYHEGELHGEQRTYDQRGQLTKVTNYLHGVKHGIEYVYYTMPGPLRLQSETMWSNGEKDGTSKWYYPEGNVSTVYEYRQGSIEGEVIYYHENGTKRQSTLYKNNQKEGVHYEWYPNGENKVIGQYSNNRQSGTWYYYDENGALERELAY